MSVRINAVVAATFLAAATVIAAPVALAQEQTLYRFDLPAQPLAEALRAIARQTGANVLFESKDLSGIRAKELKGRLTTAEAIQRVLEGTKLQAQQTTPTTVVVQPASTDSSARMVEDPVQSQNTIALEEIVVTGTNIAGQGPIGSPLETYTREDIQRGGANKLSEFFQSSTQNTSTVIGATDGNPRVSNWARGSEIQLRGLGVGTTLTLVDGHRLASGGALGAFVDYSSIPVSAIDHVEILPDGASAIYGSDAIGGVVNIVLRKDFNGIETSARASFRPGGGDQQEASVVWGHSWAGGHFLAGYNFLAEQELKYGDRSQYSTSGDQTRHGGGDFRLGFNNPATIYTAAGLPAFAIPRGQDGRNLTAAQLIPNTANYLDLSNSDIFPRTRAHSLFFNASQMLFESVEIFADGRWGHRDVETVTSGTAALTVPATNPFYVNAFGNNQPLRVRYSFEKDLGAPRQLATAEPLSGTLGAKVRLGSWTLTPAATYAREKVELEWTNQADRDAYTAALADTNPATALNVFGDGSFTNRDTLERIRSRRTDLGDSTLFDSSVVASGPIFDLPAGLVRLALGASHRKEEMEFVPSNIINIGQGSQSERAIDAVFAELSIPVVGAANALPGIRSLQLSAAIRSEEYDDFGSTTNPKLGIAWLPLDGLTVRGTWGTSFRAPPFYLSNPVLNPTRSNSSNVPDSTSPTNSRLALVVFEPRYGLEPETSTSWTAGFDIAPVHGISVAATYWNIEYVDKLATPPNNLLSLGNQFAPYFIRNPSASQIAEVCNRPDFNTATACPPNVGAIVYLGYTNFAGVETQGLDLNVTHSVALWRGELTSSLRGSKVFHFDQTVAPTAPALDVVGTVGNSPDIKLRGSISYSRNGWALSGAVNHVGAYRDIAFPQVPRVGSWTTFDGSVSRDFANAGNLLNGTRISLSWQNLFNAPPPFVNVLHGYDVANAEVAGRLISIQLTKAW